MLVYDQQQPVRSEIRSFLQFVPLGGARWDSCRYPLNIFNSAKRSPPGASFSAIKRFQRTPATASTDSMNMVKKVMCLTKPADFEKSYVDFDHI